MINKPYKINLKIRKGSLSILINLKKNRLTSKFNKKQNLPKKIN